MSYGRQTAMDALRKAGSKLNQMDTAYAEALVPEPATSMVGTIGAFGRGVPISEIYNAMPRMDGGVLRDARPDERNYVDALYETALYAGNIGSRYALPAGGVTLAGKGLYDLTAAFGNGADYPEEGQLPLG